MGEEIKIKSLVITEKEREFTTNINGDDFTIRIPLPSDKITIMALTARVLGGQDLKAFPPNDTEYARMLVTLNNVLVGSPKWWTGASNCIDETVLSKLWQHYLDSEIKFQEFLKKNTDNKLSGESKPSN